MLSAMPSLEKRRYVFDVTFLYKALNGYLNLDSVSELFLFQTDPYRFRHVDDYSLKSKFARTATFEVRLAPSLAAFKLGVKRNFALS